MFMYMAIMKKIQYLDTISSALSTYEKTLAKFKESGHVMAVMNGGA